MSYDLYIMLWSSQADNRISKSAHHHRTKKQESIAPRKCIGNSRNNCDPLWAADGKAQCCKWSGNCKKAFSIGMY